VNQDIDQPEQTTRFLLWLERERRDRRIRRWVTGAVALALVAVVAIVVVFARPQSLASGPSSQERPPATIRPVSSPTSYPRTGWCPPPNLWENRKVAVAGYGGWITTCVMPDTIRYLGHWAMAGCYAWQEPGTPLRRQGEIPFPGLVTDPFTGSIYMGYYTECPSAAKR
jgi:hypothetical protein